jgi:transcriptional regulator with XRE-family HTH domain
MAQPVKRILADRGLRQNDVAASVGAKQAMFNFVVNGHRKGSPELRAKLSNLLGVPVSALFDDGGDQ